MPKTTFTSADDYIASQPAAVRPVLERVRSIIRKAMPNAEELISYNIPTYKLDGSTVVHFAGWKEHYSLYPMNRRVIAALRDELAPFRLEKSTLRLSLSRPVPAKLIERIVKFRAEEIAKRRRGVAAKKRKPDGYCGHDDEPLK